MQHAAQAKTPPWRRVSQRLKPALTISVFLIALYAAQLSLVGVRGVSSALLSGVV